MEQLPVNPSCALSGTKYCRELNMGSCETCTVRNSERFDGIKQDIDLYETLLPAGGVAKLFLTEECQFCKGETKGARAGYAILDMAHPEPKRIQKWLLGKRVSKIGTMIPVQLSVCKRCRTTFRLMELMPTVFPVVFGAGGLALVGTGALADKLVNVSPVLPFAVWIVLIVAGLFLGRGVSKAIQKKAETRMIADVAEHPVIAEMLEKGWTPVSKQSRTKLLFSKTRFRRGLGTAEITPQEQAAAE